MRNSCRYPDKSNLCLHLSYDRHSGFVLNGESRVWKSGFLHLVLPVRVEGYNGGNFRPGYFSIDLGHSLENFFRVVFVPTDREETVEHKVGIVGFIISVSSIAWIIFFEGLVGYDPHVVV